MIIKPRKLRKLDDEEWMDFPDSEGRYKISNYGRVKSFVYNKKDGTILKCGTANAFRFVKIFIKGGAHMVNVCYVVGKLWVPKPSEDCSQLIHLDWNSLNNYYKNLQWITYEAMLVRRAKYLKENYHNNGLPKIITNTKLKVNDIMLLKSMLQREVTQAKIAKMFCISEMQVTRIKRGENWGDVQPAMVLDKIKE